MGVSDELGRARLQCQIVFIKISGLAAEVPRKTPKYLARRNKG
jgi:hypothetical protein